MNESFFDSGMEMSEEQLRISNELLKAKKRKKIIILISVSLLILGLIALVLFFALKRSQSPGDNDRSIQEFNPYFSDDPPQQQITCECHGILKMSQKYIQNFKLQLRNQLNEQTENLTDSSYYKPVDPHLIPNNDFNKWAFNVQYTFSMSESQLVRLQVQDKDQEKPYQVPEEIFKRPPHSPMERLELLGFQISNSPFSFSFSDINTGTTYISSKNRKLLLSEKFSEIGFDLPSRKCFGLGFRNGQFQLKNGTYTLNARGRNGILPKDEGLGGTSGNHIHPFIMCQGADQNYVGMFFVSTAVQTFEILYLNETQTVLNYISLDGQLEMYFILKKSIQEVVQMYHNLIRKPFMPPYYSLGVTQTTQGVNYFLAETLENLISNSTYFSLEGFHVDNFNYNETLFEVVRNPRPYQQVITKIHENKQIFSIGINGTFNFESTSYAKNLSDSLNCNVKSNLTNEALVGQGNFAYLNYPEVFNQQCSYQFFQQGLNFMLNNGFQQVYDQMEVKGMEFINMVNGEVIQQKSAQKSYQKYEFLVKEKEIGECESYLINTTLKDKSYYYLPFIPGYQNSGFLDNMTISSNATRNFGSFSLPEYYVHNANCHSGMKVIYQAFPFSELGKRPYIFSDCSWAGSGQYSAALISHLPRTNEAMKTSISMAFQLSLYGFSSIMVDACGTEGKFGTQEEEICGRWMQLAAYFPQARNHYYYKVEPTRTPEFAYFKDSENQYIVQRALNQKLSISLYVYSQMFYLHKHGGLIMRPLYFDFSEDDNLLVDTEQTFMLGQALMVVPPLTFNKTYQAYFPKGKWGNINKMEELIESEGQNITLKRDYFVNVYLKEGQIIPYLDIKNEIQKLNTQLMRESHRTTLIINRDKDKQASGYVLFDDGISKHSLDQNKHQFWKIQMNHNSISFWLESGDIDYFPDKFQQNILERIIILNADDFESNIEACLVSVSGGNELYQNLTAHTRMIYNQLEIVPKDEKIYYFSQIKFIEIGQNTICHSSNLLVETTSKKTNSTSIQMNFKPIWLGKPEKTMKVEFDLLDNFGSIQLKMEDQDSKIKYIPFNLITLPQTNITEDINTYVFVTDWWFRKINMCDYTIYSSDKSYSVLHTEQIRAQYEHNFFIQTDSLNITNDSKRWIIMSGERTSDFFLVPSQDSVYSSFSFNQQNQIENGKPPGKNKNGFQSIIAFRENDRNYFHAIISLSPYPYELNFFDIDNKIKMTTIQALSSVYRYFLRAPDLEALVKRIQTYIGKPISVPMWAFGIQQCRRGLVNSEKFLDQINNYTINDIPLDQACLDIDYLENYKMFDLSFNYYNLTDTVKDLHAKGIKIIPVITPGIAKVQDPASYTPLQSGLQEDIFIKAPNDEPLEGQNYGRRVYYPDFTNPKTQDWWAKNLKQLQDTIKFDGVWLIDNEITNECNGYCDQNQKPAHNIKNTLIYTPGSRDLETNTIGLDAKYNNSFTEFDMHSMYGYYQVKATHEYFKSQNQVPFVMSASNFLGMGKYGHHWIGENWLTEEYLRLSVQQMYSYSFYGMPFVGADICGTYTGVTDILKIAKLCTRWYQLGSFYPYARIYTKNYTISLDPSAFKGVQIEGSTHTYFDLIREALRFRYNLIRYYFSEFQKIAEEGGSFFKPLAFEFGENQQAYEDTSNQIMLGSALMLTIQVSDLQKQETDYYFPEGTWCQIYPEDAMDCFNSTGVSKNGTFQSFNSSIEDYQVHLRQGFIVPIQHANTKIDLKNTQSLENYKMDLILYPNPSQENSNLAPNAIGQMYFESPNQIGKVNSLKVVFNAKGKGGEFLFTKEPTWGEGKGNREEIIENIKILGGEIGKDLDAYVYMRNEPQKAKQLPKPYGEQVTVSVQESIYEIIKVELIAVN